MDLMKMLIENGGLVRQVAQQVGLDERQASSAVSQLLPALAAGVKDNIAKPGGLEGLLSAIQSGNHTRYVENPSEIANDQGIEDGKHILGHVLGSKDRSRAVAAQAAQATGIDVEKLKSMLPMIATMMMGGISKTAASSGLGRQTEAPSQSGGMLGAITGGGGFGAILGQMLDMKSPGAQGQTGQQRKKGGILDIVGRFFK